MFSLVLANKLVNKHIVLICFNESAVWLIWEYSYNGLWRKMTKSVTLWDDAQWDNNALGMSRYKANHNKNIERNTVYTIVTRPNPKQ